MLIADHMEIIVGRKLFILIVTWLMDSYNGGDIEMVSSLTSSINIIYLVVLGSRLEIFRYVVVSDYQ